MKVKIFALVAAFFMLMGGSAWAQSDVKGDVNKDGVVNEQDIAAILAIMQETGGVKEQIKYYWYLGTSNPAEMTSIDPIVSDNSSTGWRLIGTELPTYNANSPLWNGDLIGFSRNYYFVAVPNTSIQIYNAANASVMNAFNNAGTVKINGVNYTIYASIAKASGFAYKVF